MRNLPGLALPLALACLAGCSSNPGKNPEPVEITGRVTLPGGKAVDDVTFNLQPTGPGGQAALPVTNGEFKGTVMPGRYTYYLSEGKRAASLQAVPQKYRTGSMDRQITVAAGAKLEVSLE